MATYVAGRSREGVAEYIYGANPFDVVTIAVQRGWFSDTDKHCIKKALILTELNLLSASVMDVAGAELSE